MACDWSIESRMRLSTATPPWTGPHVCRQADPPGSRNLDPTPLRLPSDRLALSGRGPGPLSGRETSWRVGLVRKRRALGPAMRLH
ncbi:hypothetical protein SKAU_G00027940 [Synaphobranchus kaupii]|uniref:Uncharacterized protein n=1 Tax=Synaphobranchus kaupii TaxID=118154 RepID=A0A9Q1JCV4_SYNKA|nr:hypothetical protein SKAU_G00027940 [Synaphobranchus kaupii]